MAARLTAYVVVGIVAATLIAGLIVGAQRNDVDGPIDLIIHNGRLYAADEDGTTADALAVRGNQIVRVGSDRDVLRLQRPQTRMIDAQGAAILPGFNDAHLHFIAGGLALAHVDLTGAATLEDVQQRIRSWASANPDRPWVIGRGWDHQPFGGALPTRQTLDVLVPHRPAYLVSRDGHAAWVNTPALRLSGINRRTPDPVRGVIVRDPRTGDATGVLEEEAISLVGRFAPAPRREDRARALRAAIVEAHRYGVTSVQVAGATVEDLELYDEAARSGELEVRVFAALAMHDGLDEAALARVDGLKQQYAGSPLFKSGALKITLDGVVESHTAAMLAPYANRADAGTPRVTPDDLNRFVRLADARGWQILIHAAGDRAVRMALDAYAHAERSNPNRPGERRHRIEHADLIGVEDVRRFDALGVIASMQPVLGTPLAPNVELWNRTLGPERAARRWPYRAVSAARGSLAFGSDWPAAALNPMLGIHTAATRTTPDGEPAGGWQPAQRLALEAAVNAYTSGAARASFDERRKGVLEAGMLADIVVMSENIFNKGARLADARAAVTVFDGRIVYRRDRVGTD